MTHAAEIPRPQSAAAAIEITRATPSEARDWDRYVENHSEGGFFHLFGWGEVIETAYGYAPHYLIARRAGKIVGVVPVVDVKAPLLGRSFISTAFTVGGGPIGDDDAVVTKLAEAVAEAGEAQGVRYIEFRSGETTLGGWRQKTGAYANFAMALPGDEEDHLGLIRRRRRAEIRKALAAEAAGQLSLRLDGDADEFYRFYATSLRNHGTPVFPRRFLDALLRVFAGKTEISVVEVNGAPAAALLSFRFKNSYLPYYVGATALARGARAHEYHYWKLMRLCVERGIERFDFGRSKIDTGPYRFKKLWGAEPIPITYQYKLIAAREVPNINPKNPKFETLTKLWRRLPLPVANALGPMLARNFP
ncbi:MAG: FemAB family PEP-CTERM system-associated protein [Alphaproteobacteria bacterium]|nr:FemAB family PEP-CTERM system-associated protein [Alphaproteobacteria bacterium]